MNLYVYRNFIIENGQVSVVDNVSPNQLPPVSPLFVIYKDNILETRSKTVCIQSLFKQYDPDIAEYYLTFMPMPDTL